MFLWAGVRFPCFPFASLFPALQHCQGAPFLGAGVFVFPESGAPTGGSSPGQLQMRNSWTAALAATQIRPFEKITVLLLLPPPPVGHARSAEGRGMCRRAGEGRERRGKGALRGGGHISFDLFQKVFLITFLLPLFKCFNFCCIEQVMDCSQIKPDRVFPPRQEMCDTVQVRRLPPPVVFWLLVFVS